MRKSELLSNKLHKAEYYLEIAKRLVNEVIDLDESGDGISAGLFNNSIERTLELIDDLGYEIIMPIEMAEDEANSIDIGSGIYDAREGNEGEIGRVEHQLNTHKDHDCIAANDNANSADSKEQTCNVEVVIWIHYFSSTTVVSTTSSWNGLDSSMSPRALSVAEIELGAADPSGRRAGTSTALWRANTPGFGRPAALPRDSPRKRAIACSRCVTRGTARW